MRDQNTVDNRVGVKSYDPKTRMAELDDGTIIFLPDLTPAEDEGMAEKRLYCPVVDEMILLKVGISGGYCVRRQKRILKIEAITVLGAYNKDDIAGCDCVSKGPREQKPTDFMVVIGDYSGNKEDKG